MSGFLDKKRRNIDYKLTRSGINQLQKDVLNFKYYTLSDKSIVYKGKYNKDIKKNISISEKSYLPFETDTYVEDINPELYLSDYITDENKEDIYFFDNKELNTKKTLAERIISQEILYFKDLSNINKIDIEKYYYDDNVNLNINDRNSYPTLKNNQTSISKLVSMRKDTRFSDKTRFLELVPKGLVLKDLNPVNNIENPIDFFYKNYSTILKDISFLNKVETLDVLIKNLENDSKLIKNKIKLKKETSTNEDLYIFQLYEKKESEKLEKLHFIDLTNSIKNKLNGNKFFLIGKLIKKIDKQEIINKESKVKIMNINTDYCFINLFTLVVEV